MTAEDNPAFEPASPGSAVRISKLNQPIDAGGGDSDALRMLLSQESKRITSGGPCEESFCDKVGDPAAN
jgi:hypothetical protein